MGTAVLADGKPLVIGDQWVATLTLQRDANNDGTAEVVDLTGSTVTCSIKRMADDTTVITGHSVTVTTAASGIVTLTVTAAESAALKPGPYIMDFKSVISSVPEHFGPVIFNARNNITA